MEKAAVAVTVAAPAVKATSFNRFVNRHLGFIVWAGVPTLCLAIYGIAAAFLIALWQ